MREKIIQILQELIEVDSGDIDVGLNPVDDLEMDSISIVNLIIRVEEEFDCDFEEFDELNQHMHTVEEMVEFIASVCAREEGGK